VVGFYQFYKKLTINKKGLFFLFLNTINGKKVEKNLGGKDPNLSFFVFFLKNRVGFSVKNDIIFEKVHILSSSPEILSFWLRLKLF